MIDAARDEWLALLSASLPGQRLLEAGTLHCYYGVDDDLRPVFLVVSDYESTAPKLAELVRVEHGARSDGRWTVVLTLSDRNYAETFVGMCLELCRRVAVENDEPSALRLFDKTIEQWRRLLSLKGARRLTEGEIRGLAAELVFLIDRAADTTPRTALEAWVGPHGAPQDFRFASGQVFELKAVRTGATLIHISSVEQLEVGQQDSLTLVLQTLNDVPSGSPAPTVVSLIGRLRQMLDDDINAVDQLDEKLALLEFDVSDPYYATRHFEVGPSRSFRVDATFPRIRTSQMPLGVERVKYQLRLAALGSYEINQEQPQSTNV